MEFFRLFTAVRPPTDILDAIVEAQHRLREQIDADSVRWIGRENMHVTLQFLGDTPAGQIQDVIDAMAEGVSLVAGPSEIDLTVGGVGAFPSVQRPRVVWIGIQDGSGELARIQRAVTGQLRERGFLPDGKPFRPHITMGYVRRRATHDAVKAIAAAVRGSHAGTEAGRTAVRFTVSELLLVRSTLSQSGAIYSDLHSVPLSPASSRISSGESARE